MFANTHNNGVCSDEPTKPGRSGGILLGLIGQGDVQMLWELCFEGAAAAGEDVEEEATHDVQIKLRYLLTCLILDLLDIRPSYLHTCNGVCS